MWEGEGEGEEANKSWEESELTLSRSSADDKVICIIRRNEEKYRCNLRKN